MNGTANDPIEAELAQAGSASGLSPNLLELEKNRITSMKVLPPMEFLFSLFDELCFPRRELVAFTGRAKSGKTFVISILMTLCVSREILTFKRIAGTNTDLSDNTDNFRTNTDLSDSTDNSRTNTNLSNLTNHSCNSCNSCSGKASVSSVSSVVEKNNSCNSCNSCSKKEQPLRVLWYDTEQSDNSTQDILVNRIIPLFHRTMGPDEPFPEHMFDIFNVRNVDRANREVYFLEAIEHYRPDLVILDGIRDLVSDINDGTVAQDMMEKLMKTAQTFNCCMVCVLHQNKSGDSRDPRGWLGTELLNKAYDVFATEKIMPQRIFKLEQLYTRKYDIEQCLYFTVDDEGLPCVTEAPPAPTYISQDGSPCGEERPSLNDDYVIHYNNGSWEIDVARLFTDAFKGYETLTGAALRFSVMNLAHIATRSLYNNCLDKAMKMNLMTKSFDAKKRVIYRLNVTEPPKPQPTQQMLWEDGAPF